jgi:hypothetical protein
MVSVSSLRVSTFLPNPQTGLRKESAAEATDPGRGRSQLKFKRDLQTTRAG